MTVLIVLPKAEADLFEIETFSAHEFGPRVAGEYMDALESAFDRLSDHPESGPEYEGIRPRIRYLSVGKHRVFYDYDGNVITVVRVLHQAMAPETYL